MNKLTNYLFVLVITLSFFASFNATAAPANHIAKNSSLKKAPSNKKRRAVFTCDQYSRKILIRKSSRYKDTINHAARKYGVSANFIRAVIAVESCFNSRATGGLGETGLMQLMPGTARELGVKNGYSPWQNIHGGTKYLKSLLKRYNGNKAYAAAAYNGGPGAVSKTSGPRFNQVKRYSKKVMRAYNTMSKKSSNSTRTYAASQNSTKNKNWKTHKVKSGQTLYLIAKKHRTSVSKLKRLNSLKSDKIHTGSKLRVY